MGKIFESSFLLRALNAAARWIDGQWAKSPLGGFFTRVGRGEAAAESSVFFRLWRLLAGWIFRLFRFLRLDRLFAGSILQRTALFAIAAAAAAPLVPTMALLALVALGFLSFLIRVGTDADFRPVYSPVNLFIWLFAGVYLVCTFSSVTPEESLEGGLLTFAFVLFAFVLMNGVRTRRDADRLTGLLVAAGAAVSCYGIYQAVTGVTSTSTWVDTEKFASLTLRVYATLDNPNVLSEYLLLVIPLGAACTCSGRGWKRLAALAATGLMAVCMLLTYSRGGWLGLIAAAALFLVLLDRRFIVLGLVCGLGLLFVLPESVLARFSSITDLSDSSTTYRIAIWLGAITMLKQYWFCGLGTGTAAFTAVYPAYSFNAVSAPHAHNLFLQITCECGVCGLLSLLGAILAFYRCCGQALRAKPDRPLRLRLIALMSGVFGFLLQSLTDHSFYNYRVMFLFWVFMALSVIYAKCAKEQP